MRKQTVWSRLKTFLHRPLANQQGQSIIIIAFAFLGLIAMLGLALDMGLVYIEQTRLKRAADAAALAGVVELPNEEQAIIRAINYLDANGYTLRDATTGQPQVNVYIRGCAHDGYLSPSTGLTNYHADDSPKTSINDTIPAGRKWAIQWSVNPQQAGDTSVVTSQEDYYYLYFPANGSRVTNPIAEFFIDTRTYQSRDDTGDYDIDTNQCNAANDLFGTANKIRLQGVVPVGMNFMQFFGFQQVEVADAAIGQNVTSLDVAIVFDVSGSMQFDVSGYGFYEPYDSGTNPPTPWYDLNYGTDYPDPQFLWPVPVDHLPTTDRNGQAVGSLTYGIASGNTALENPPTPDNTGNLCWPQNTPGYLGFGGSDPRQYIVIEAELYSLNTSLLFGPFRQPGQGFWAVQNANCRMIDAMQNGGSCNWSTYNTGATPILRNNSRYRNSWVAHHPYVEWAIDPNPPSFAGFPFGHNYTLDETRSNPNSVPSLEYDFITSSTWNGNTGDDTRIWIRAQRAGGWTNGTPTVYWAVYDYSQLYGPAGGDPTLATPLGSGQIEPGNNLSTRGAWYGGAQSNKWRWIELTSASQSTNLNLDDNKRYTLKIWAAETGFDIDQIVIGNRNSTAFTSNYGSGTPAQAQANAYATPGSAFRQACNRCNPIYGLEVSQADCQKDNDWVTDVPATGTLDRADPAVSPLYRGYQPIRDAKEAVKRFIRQLNPQFDQVGFVAYNHKIPDKPGSTQVNPIELRCRRRYSAAQCFQGTTPISFTEVLNVVEVVPPSGATNIAAGILKGLEMLGINADNKGSFDNSCSTDTAHCSRGGSARRVMIVMTDGVANQNPYDNNISNVNCYAQDLYQPNVGSTSIDRAKDCVIYYGQIAANNNVTIYTIGLGNGVDTQMMEALATLPGSDGQFFAAASSAQLDEIFDTILKSISVRLIQ